tara:strand:- start:94 stop:2052 length:1959 start_codon:yes stop_codon:yes gene_type:complete
MKYRAEIDGLRALAVLPVILYHAGFEWFGGGFVGVDVFFVISGYLISTIIFSEMAEGNFSIVNFYERRARRILPALFFVMAACLPFAWFWMLPQNLLDFGESMVAVSTFVSNIFFWRESGYFANASEFKPLIHTWSLAVEEQFYILFPLFLMIFWRFGIKWVTLILVFIFLISLSLAEWASMKYPSPNFFLLPTRGWELLVGVFISIYLKYNTHFKSHAANQILSLFGFAMIVYSIFYFQKSTPFPSLYALIPTFGTGLLILTAVQSTLIHKFLSIKPIVGLGLVSYSAYLWHQPLLAFARYRFIDQLSDIYLLLLCGLSIIIAWFSWRYVERPFRNKAKITKQRIFQFSILGTLFFILVGTLIIHNEGFKNRNYELNQLSTKLAWPAEGNISNGCISKFGGDQYCVVSDVTQPISMLLIGDSHANHFFIGLDNYLKQKGENLLMLGAGGCPPLIDVDMGFHHEHGVKLKCFDRMNTLYKNTFNNNNISRVYLSFAQHTLFDMRLSFIDIQNEINFSTDRYKSIKAALIRTINYFKKQGSEVVIIEDLPDSNIEEYAACIFWKRDENSCLQKLMLKETTKQYDLLLTELESEGYKVMRTQKGLEYFPYTNFSDKDVTNNFLYRDNTHLSKEGSTYVIESSKISNSNIYSELK